ncbi:MAG: type II toxin-antitoxin system RelE/ParE family toxin [Candidatus Aenigmarchaeota archaeon]|nr:type II toxin-antitoxin system RelE/ParE family toxin [Candidatus Aenigmarchaeota archaeon]
MVEIKFIVPTEKFENDVKKIKDKGLKEKLQKQIIKVSENPNFGKPLRYDLSGEWSTYVKPYRLIYKVEGDKLILLRFEHRKEVYER